MAFDGIAHQLSAVFANDRAAMSRFAQQLENEVTQLVNTQLSKLNGQPAPSTDPSVNSRLTALEQYVAGLQSALGDMSRFEADASAKFSAEDQDAATTHDRLTAIETALGSMNDALTAQASAEAPTSGNSVDPAQTSNGSVSSDSGSSATPPVSAALSSGAVTQDQASPVGASPTFAKDGGDGTATIPGPVQTDQGNVDPMATNPSAIAAGASAPVSGGVGPNGGLPTTDPNAGPLSTAVSADAPGNSTQAQMSAPAPTPANVAAPGPYDPNSARNNPAPAANTEQDAPKAPIVNALGPDASASTQRTDATQVSANTATSGSVGEASPDQPAAAS